MFYKSLFIGKNRIFPYFQNKLKNVNNIIIIIMIIIIIVIIINIREQIIQKKMDKKKRYNCYKILNYTKYTKFSII